MIQEDEHSCYKCVVREAIRWAYGEKGQPFLLLEGLENDFLSMKRCLGSKGVPAEGVQLSGLGALPPKDGAIAQVCRNGRSHFLFLWGRKKGRVCAYDPAHGTFALPVEEVEKEMSGKVLWVRKGTLPRRTSRGAPRIFPWKITATWGFFSLLRCVLGALFLYTFRSELPWFLPLMFGALFFSTVAFQGAYSARFLKRYVRRRVLPLLAGEGDGKASFSDGVSLASEEMKRQNGAMNRLTFLFLILFLVAHLNAWYALLFLGNLLFSFGWSFALRKPLSERKALLGYREEKRVLEKGDEEGFDGVWSDSFRYSFLRWGAELIPWAILALTTFLFCAFANGMDLGSFLGVFFMYGGSISYVVKILSDVSEQGEQRRRLYRLGGRFLSELSTSKDMV